MLVENGFPADVVLLAADQSGAELTREFATHPDVAIIDYTGSSTFGDWLRANARQALLYSEETGVHSIVIAATDDFEGICANIAFSLALYSGKCAPPRRTFSCSQAASPRTSATRASMTWAVA